MTIYAPNRKCRLKNYLFDLSIFIFDFDNDNKTHKVTRLIHLFIPLRIAIINSEIEIVPNLSSCYDDVHLNLNAYYKPYQQNKSIPNNTGFLL